MPDFLECLTILGLRFYGLGSMVTCELLWFLKPPPGDLRAMAVTPILEFLCPPKEPPN